MEYLFSFIQGFYLDLEQSGTFSLYHLRVVSSFLSLIALFYILNNLLIVEISNLQIFSANHNSPSQT